MPRFYFDFKSADYIAKDRIGTVLRDVTAAKAEATIAAAEWIKDHACVEGTELCLSVRNGSRTPVFVVNASIKVGPGTR
jgi:hypothetical protein